MNTLPDNPDLVPTRGWIDGQEVDSGNEFSVMNPATQSTVAEVSDLGAQHARDAIAAATAAFASWKTVALQQRVDCILRWATLIAENADDLGEIVRLETGKPLPQAKGAPGPPPPVPVEMLVVQITAEEEPKVRAACDCEALGPRTRLPLTMTSAEL